MRVVKKNRKENTYDSLAYSRGGRIVQCEILLYEYGDLRVVFG